MIGKPLTNYQYEFIISNAGLMKQKVIAEKLGVTPACVCKVLKRAKKDDQLFNIDDFKKYYAV